jgi:subtilisin family serine protease
MRYFFILFLCFYSWTVKGQDTYLVYLKQDKIQYEANPALSSVSIEKRLNNRLPIDHRDFRISNNTLQQLRSYGIVKCQSRWLTACAMEMTEQNAKAIGSIDIVLRVIKLKSLSSKKASNSKYETTYTEKEYGQMYAQVKMHEGQALHDQGFQGQGQRIAVFDAGFSELPTIQSFRHLFIDNRVFSSYNFVYDTSNVYGYDGHGTAVLGCMASFLQDTIVGTAPKADYYLFVTEDVRSESKVEEVNWALAAEMADSIGVDIIQSSLGYSTFDDPATNYKPHEMDGQTAISSIAANIATSKGILVVSSAGNSGNNSWRIINAPADADDVVAVGAVNYDRSITNFSSRGYNSKGVIKPNVCAVGRGTALFVNNGNVSFGNGTSFASPTIAGLAACLWQQNKTWSAQKIRSAIYLASDKFASVDSDYGFGIPDFSKATRPILVNSDTAQLKIFPNPSSKSVILEFYSTVAEDRVDVVVYSFNKVIKRTSIDVKKGLNQLYLDIDGLAAGLQFVRIQLNNSNIWGKFLKN